MQRYSKCGSRPFVAQSHTFCMERLTSHFQALSYSALREGEREEEDEYEERGRERLRRALQNFSIDFGLSVKRNSQDLLLGKYSEV